MLPRPPACRGAVQRQLPTTIESLWVTDDILRHEWQRFARGCRIGRRYGSFVPGPLESRRRMGKRRMAHLSEAFPPPLPSIASLWGSFWGADRSQWQWQAPRKRKFQENGSTAAHDSSDWWEESRRVAETVPKLRVASRSTIKVDIKTFQEKLKGCQSDELSTVCQNFNKLLARSLSLGLLSEGAVTHTLGTISKDLRAAFPNPDAAATQCLSFYTATWEGLVACKILPMEQMGSAIPTVLLKLLARLPMTSGLGTLAFEIVSQLSPSHLENSTRATCSIVVRLLKAWLQEYSIHSQSSCIPLSQSLIRRPCCGDLGIVKMSAKRRRLISRISKQKMSAAESADDIRVADTLVPSQIGKILRHLPQHGMEVIIRHSTQHISKFYKDHKLLPMDLRYSWLLLVSELPSTKPVFFDAWRILDASGALRNQKLMSIVLLRHWISQGKVTHNPSLEQDIRHHALWGSDFGIGTMIALLDKRQENVRMEQGQLFKMLLVNRQFSTIYDVFSQFKALGMKMPIKTAARIVEAVSEHDHVLAFRIFQKCTAICFRGERMLAEFCPNFVLSMIHDPNIHPRRIWGIVNVPIYGELRHTCTKPRSTNRYIMTPAMAALLTNMAMAFAHCKNRSPGVILRNVTQCLRHLRRHRAPLNPRITRAITHASINLRIEFDKLVPQERADWALRMIRKVEGHKVAETVTMIVDVWNGHKRRNLR